MADDTAPAGMNDIEWLDWMAAHGYPTLGGPNAKTPAAAPSVAPAAPIRSAATPVAGNIYAQTSSAASKMSLADLQSTLKTYLNNEASLTPDQHLLRGIYATEYANRMQPPSSQHNVTDPATGVTRPVTEFSGYDPAGASQSSWQSLISGKPIPTVGGNGPSDQTQAPWNQRTILGAIPKVGYAPAGPHMEYDSTTGLPILNTPPGMAASHFSMGGPNSKPFPSSAPTASADGSDTQSQPYKMAPLGAPIRHLLEGIAGPESGGAYNIRYAGNTPAYFSGYDKHPNISEKIPGTDQTSTAAGKYQFLNSTWQQVSRQLGLKDFSPQSQDQGAAYLARSTYKTATGRDLDSDLADPTKFSTIASTLHSQWPSITGQNVATAMGQPLPPDGDATTAPSTPASTPSPAVPQQPSIDPRLQQMQQQQLALQKFSALNNFLKSQQPQQAANPWLAKAPWLQPILQSTQTNPMQANYQAMQEMALANNQLTPTQEALGSYQTSLMNPLKTQGT